MNLFNENGTIQTFENVEDILKYWYDIRLKKYIDRREYLIGKINNELDKNKTSRENIKIFHNYSR